MSVFDDDEDDEQEAGSAGARVAAALNPQEEDEPADDGADTRAGSQQDAKQQAQKDQPNDTSAQELAQSPEDETVNAQGHPDANELEDGAVTPDQALGEMAGYSPVKALTAPTLKPYSTAPVEAAQELANAKSSFDPTQYKPSGWRRAGAAIAGALTGFGTRNAAEGTRVGEMALNGPLDRAKAAEGQKEAGLQSKVDAGDLANKQTGTENANAMQEYGLQERDFRNQAYANSQNATAADRQSRAQDRDNAITQFTPTDPNNPYAGGTGVTAAGKTVPNVAPPDKWIQTWAKTPAGVAATLKMTTDARQKVADQIFGKGNTTEKQEFVATGKISRAAKVSIPSAPLQEYTDWKTQFHKENNRDPNAAEIAAWGHKQSGGMSANLADRIESQKNTQLNKAQSQYRDNLSTAQTPEEQQAARDQYLTDWQEAQDEYEQRVSEATGQDIHHVTIKDNVDPKTLEWHGQAPPNRKPAMQQAAQPPQQAAPAQQTAAPAPNPAAAAPKTFQYKGATYKQGQPVNVNGKPAIVTGLNPQTGKLQVQAQGQ